MGLFQKELLNHVQAAREELIESLTSEHAVLKESKVYELMDEVVT